jgi:RimJ/RimL family protein N-acetyltransferase
MVLRLACAQDSADLFRWRNDATTRRNFRTTQEVPWADHCRWLDQVLCDPDRTLYVGMVDGAAVGTVRFDRTGPDRFETTVTVNPDCRQRGYGKLLLATACATMRETLTTEIRDENDVSKKVFAHCGFRLVQPLGDSGLSLYLRPGR